MRSIVSEPAALQIIRTNTQLRPVALVPEIRLRQASEPIGVWQHTELAAGRTGLDPPFWAFAWAGGQALAWCSRISGTSVTGLSWVLARMICRAAGPGTVLRITMLPAVRLKSHSRADGVRENPRDPRRSDGNCRSRPAY